MNNYTDPKWMTDIKAVITIPADDLGRGKCSIGVTWPDDIEATHKVRTTRTSWDDPVDSKYRIPLSSLGGLLDKMYEVTGNKEIIVWFAVENDENLICIEIYDDYRE